MRKKLKKVPSKKKAKTVKKTEKAKKIEKPKFSILDEEDEDAGKMDIAELANKLTPKEKKTEEDSEEKVNKHKLPGKHKLKYDSIFKGKKTEVEEDTSGHRIEGFDIDPFSSSHGQKFDQAEYDRLKKLKEKVYELIIAKTEINIKNNRRKPGRIDFNRYFETIAISMDNRDYSHAEIFIELSWYFSENVFSMFKLLEPKWGAIIVRELSEKYNIQKIDGFEFI
jgi:hypothetical protein